MVIMGILVIVISYILATFLFYILIKRRFSKSNNKKDLNRIYILIVLILFFLVIWSIFRNI